MKLRRVAAITLGILVLLTPLLGEWLYRTRVRSQASDRIAELRAAHARQDPPVVEVYRFGTYTDGISPSLLEDLKACLARYFGRASALEGCCSIHGYLKVQLQWGELADRDVHTLLWSPRRLTFVPWEERSRCLLVCSTAGE